MGNSCRVQLKLIIKITFLSSCLDRKKHLSRIASFPFKQFADQEF